MPTSSIFHNFVIDNAEDAERFILAMEESERDGHQTVKSLYIIPQVKENRMT